MKNKGLIIVHTGDGKGKTTAALGMAMRAWGNRLRVLILQFIKGSWTYGELEAIKAQRDVSTYVREALVFHSVSLGNRTNTGKLLLIFSVQQSKSFRVILGIWLSLMNLTMHILLDLFT